MFLLKLIPIFLLPFTLAVRLLNRTTYEEYIKNCHEGFTLNFDNRDLSQFCCNLSRRNYTYAEAIVFFSSTDYLEIDMHRGGDVPVKICGVIPNCVQIAQAVNNDLKVYKNLCDYNHYTYYQYRLNDKLLDIAFYDTFSVTKISINLIVQLLNKIYLNNYKAVMTHQKNDIVTGHYDSHDALDDCFQLFTVHLFDSNPDCYNRLPHSCGKTSLIEIDKDFWGTTTNLCTGDFNCTSSYWPYVSCSSMNSIRYYESYSEEYRQEHLSLDFVKLEPAYQNITDYYMTMFIYHLFHLNVEITGPELIDLYKDFEYHNLVAKEYLMTRTKNFKRIDITLYYSYMIPSISLNGMSYCVYNMQCNLKHEVPQYNNYQVCHYKYDQCEYECFTDYHELLSKSLDFEVKRLIIGQRYVNLFEFKPKLPNLFYTNWVYLNYTWYSWDTELKNRIANYVCHDITRYSANVFESVVQFVFSKVVKIFTFIFSHVIQVILHIFYSITTSVFGTLFHEMWPKLKLLLKFFVLKTGFFECFLLSLCLFYKKIHIYVSIVLLIMMMITVTSLLNLNLIL